MTEKGREEWVEERKKGEGAGMEGVVSYLISGKADFKTRETQG